MRHFKNVSFTSGTWHIQWLNAVLSQARFKTKANSDVRTQSRTHTRTNTHTHTLQIGRERERELLCLYGMLFPQLYPQGILTLNFSCYQSGNSVTLVKSIPKLLLTPIRIHAIAFTSNTCSWVLHPKEIKVCSKFFSKEATLYLFSKLEYLNILKGIN